MCETMENKKYSFWVEYSYIYYTYVKIEENVGYMPESDFSCGLFYCTSENLQNEVEERVKKYLKDIEYTNLEVNIKYYYARTDLNELDLALCPKCGSNNTYVKSGMTTDLYVCRHCGYEWR